MMFFYTPITLWMSNNFMHSRESHPTVVSCLLLSNYDMLMSSSCPFDDVVLIFYVFLNFHETFIFDGLAVFFLKD